MKHRFLPRLLPCLLLGLALAPAAPAAPALFYVNDAVVQAPPQVPPQIDAINFVNDSSFSVTLTNLVWDADTATFETTLFQTFDTLNYTNFSYMAVNPGIDFLTIPSSGAPAHMAATFFNPGSIYVGSATNLVVFGPAGLLYAGYPEMRVQATNIINGGAIVVGYEGLCSFNGQNVDLSRGSLVMTNAATTIIASTNNVVLSAASFGAGIFAGYWGLGSNTFSLSQQFGGAPQQTPPHLVTTRQGATFDQQLTLAPSGLSYWDVTQIDAETLWSAAFVNNTNTAYAPKVYFLEGYIILEWSQTITNAGATQYLYVLDDFPDVQNLDLLVNGYAGLGFARPTQIPANFDAFETAAQLNLGQSFTPESIPAGFFPFDDTQNIWTAYEAVLPPISTILSDVAGQDVTNVPGRIEVSAASTLNLSSAQISGLNYLSFQATNQFLGSTNSQIAAPYADFNLRTTNGLLIISNLVRSTIVQPEGYVDLWSTCVTNQNNGATNVYHVLFADAHLAPSTPVRSESLFLTSTNALGGNDNLVIHDVFNVTRNLRLDASRITIATNAPGSLNPAGALFLNSSSILWPSAAPRLEYLTNFGAIVTLNAAFFGGSRSSPFFNSVTNVPYAAFINRGGITNDGALIWASDFENSGRLTASAGSIQLQQGQFAILTNGLLSAVNGSISLNSGSIFASNTLFQAGSGISLAATNVLSDGISNLALIYEANPVYPTNYLYAQPTNGNSWTAGAGGLSLLSKPAAGDLLATTVTLNASFNTAVPIIWAASDLGASSAGFLNNAALGRLVLNGANNSLFTFMGAGSSSNAIYVDDLELQGYTATASDPAGDFSGLALANIKVYFAQARADGVEIAEKLNGRAGGGFIWVSNFNWGYFSSTNLLYPDGLFHRVNAALASSCDLVSNPTNTVVNCQSQSPISPVVVPPTNGVPVDVPLLTTLTATPQSQTVIQGASVTFTVQASSPWPLSYQWLLNSNDIPGAVGSSLTIPDVQAADAGYYSVVVSTFANSVISPAATLVVQTPPTILAQPQSLAVVAGASALFSVAASGPPPLSYQWFFNGTALAGATSAYYTLTNVQAANAGVYDVLVSNPFGSTTSADASLSVVPNDPNKPNVTLAILPPPTTLSTNNPAANAFAAALGNYCGLFSDTNGASALSSGAFSAKVTRGGAFSAKLTFASRSYSASGKFSPASSTASVTIERGSGLSPLTLTLLLDLSGGGQMLGSVVASTDWSATLRAYRAAPAAAASYTFLIPPAGLGSPDGYGYGAISLNSLGNLSLAGALPDGSKLSQSVFCSQEGCWPLFASLYSGQGCLVSWLQFTNSAAATNACASPLIWLDPAGATPTTYRAGFTNLITAIGAAYSPAHALAGFASGSLYLANGSIEAVTTNSFTLDSRQHVHPGPKLSLAFTTASGLFQGATWSPALRQTLSFQGVLFGQDGQGYGFFLGTDQNGTALLNLEQ